MVLIASTLTNTSVGYRLEDDSAIAMLSLMDYGNAADAPIRNFVGNEAYVTTVGLYVIKANPK